MTTRFEKVSEAFWIAVMVALILIFPYPALISPTVDSMAGWWLGLAVGLAAWTSAYLLHRGTMRVKEHISERRRSSGRPADGGASR